VLIVDDCVDTTETLALLLKLWGHETCMAHDGFAALETARLYAPDVVLLDIGLPGLDGWEVARRLREPGGPGELIVAALTGYGQEADRLRAKEIGIDYFLIKPVEPEELRRVLEACATETPLLPPSGKREGFSSVEARALCTPKKKCPT
jgi:DNA-binding response OmpR family regulator